jgi:hypothetical protein
MFVIYNLYIKKGKVIVFVISINVNEIASRRSINEVLNKRSINEVLNKRSINEVLNKRSINETGILYKWYDPFTKWCSLKKKE